jgi:hypothetical protein
MIFSAFLNAFKSGVGGSGEFPSVQSRIEWQTNVFWYIPKTWVGALILDFHNAPSRRECVEKFFQKNLRRRPLT